MKQVNHKHVDHTKKGWDTGDAPKVCTNCDFLPKTTHQKILINKDTWNVMLALCSSIKVEWQALLTGVVEENGDVRIDGYWIPKQEVGPAFVKNLDVIDDVVIAEKRIVAGIHSHANMQCFFSSTDVEDTNMSLIKHNIVINNKGEYKATSRVELPCGLVKFVDANVFTFGEQDVVIDGLTNITEKKWGFVAKDDIVVNTGKHRFNFTNNTKEEGRIDGVRWCPSCDSTPEEDGGELCVCWTKELRGMLPAFTAQNYQHRYSRVWELPPAEEKKYQGAKNKV